MKKTNKTMLTAAVLSAACAVATRIQPDSYADDVSAMAAVYGPPPGYFTSAESEAEEETGTTPAVTTTPVETMPEETTTYEPVVSSAMPLYGPPSALHGFGNVNMDNSVDIADLIEMKDLAVKEQNGEYLSLIKKNIADLNQDGKLDKTDIAMMEQYLHGLSSGPQSAEVPDGYFVSTSPEEVTTEAETTLPETTRWNQPVGTLYGPPEVLEQFEH
ncbi:dockerin type I repeat-containing protein [Ruminococcus sp. HUN007]|uniref:dockerin type I repeat-containing protein n=1 Tax=Ruminococcus sp. HUN007 TaxID=1514668 RepID=UPI0005D1BA04|nr:dockerin type I repeat-containing protein [Ruminococcus sp. HUN007]